jgi:hypothetical protein
MPDQRSLRITTLRERIERSEYRVDVDKVAEAILGRPTARMLILPSSPAVVEDESADVGEEDPAGSDGVLEAA